MNWFRKLPTPAVELIIFYNRSKEFIDFATRIGNYTWYNVFKKLTKDEKDYDINISYKFLYKEWFMYNLIPKARVFQCEFENIKDEIIITNVNINEIDKYNDYICDNASWITTWNDYCWSKINHTDFIKIELRNKYVISIYSDDKSIKYVINYFLKKFYKHRYYDLMNIQYVDLSNPYHLNDGDLILKRDGVTLVYERNKFHKTSNFCSKLPNAQKYPINLWNDIYPQGQAIKVRCSNVSKYLKLMKKKHFEVAENFIWDLYCRIFIGKFNNLNIVIILPYPSPNFTYYMNHDNSGDFFSSWQLNLLRNFDDACNYFPFFYHRLIEHDENLIEMEKPNIIYKDFVHLNYNKIYKIITKSKYSVYSLSNIEKHRNKLKEKLSNVDIHELHNYVFSEYYTKLTKCLSNWNIDLNKTLFIGNTDERIEKCDPDANTGYGY